MSWVGLNDKAASLLGWPVFSGATNGNEQGVWMMYDDLNGSQPSSLTAAQQQ